MAVPAIIASEPYAAAGVPRRYLARGAGWSRCRPCSRSRSPRSTRSSSTNWRRGAIRRFSPRSDITSSASAPSGTVGGLAVPAQRTFAPAPRRPEPRISYVEAGVNGDDHVEAEPGVAAVEAAAEWIPDTPADVERPIVSAHETSATSPRRASSPPVRPVVQPTRVEPLRSLTRAAPPAIDSPRVHVQRASSEPAPAPGAASVPADVPAPASDPLEEPVAALLGSVDPTPSVVAPEPHPPSPMPGVSRTAEDASPGLPSPSGVDRRGAPPAHRTADRSGAPSVSRQRPHHSIIRRHRRRLLARPTLR